MWNAHSKTGFRFTTEDKEFYVYAGSEAEAEQWVRHLEGASKLALKQKAQGGGLPGALGGLGAIAEDGAVAEMPEHEELDALVKEMLDSQGYKEVSSQPAAKQAHSRAKQAHSSQASTRTHSYKAH